MPFRNLSKEEAALIDARRSFPLETHGYNRFIGFNLAGLVDLLMQVQENDGAVLWTRMFAEFLIEAGEGGRFEFWVTKGEDGTKYGNYRLDNGLGRTASHTDPKLMEE